MAFLNQKIMQLVQNADHFKPYSKLFPKGPKMLNDRHRFVQINPQYMYNKVLVFFYRHGTRLYTDTRHYL